MTEPKGNLHRFAFFHKYRSCWKNCYSLTQEEQKPVLKPIMVMIDTLNELSQLRASGFGQPYPRHGLNLLYWFAHDYVEIDSNGCMTPNSSPTTGAYGFHRFHNFKDEDDHPLPSQNLPYYGVGNLGESKAYKLPLYVRKDYTHNLDDSNKDRIIVRLKDDYLERVYITEHTDQTSNKVCIEHNTQNHLLNKALSMARTLNELAQLIKSGFGQPCPRHGLNLMYWFHNRIEDDEDRLLPNCDLPYYESSERATKARTDFILRKKPLILQSTLNTTFTSELRMPSLETLNEMTQLRSSGFGQSWPRHGLKLLYWFATECVSFDENYDMISRYSPEAGHYGFHHFKNRPDRYGVQLLPDVDFHYYEVGSLYFPGAHQLPDYVTEDKTHTKQGSNMDRIIVSCDDDFFDKVYITTHKTHDDESNFDIDSTYRISKGLLMIISRLTLEGFLDEMGYRRHPVDRYYPQPISTTDNSTTRNQDCRIDMDSSSSAQNKDVQNTKGTKQQLHDSTSSQGFWETFCTIL
ncbi:hypothetical protein MHYP_G00245580 [Metynnis hypsauchen]